MSAPTWIYLANPVPQAVANRAAALLHTPGLKIGMSWSEGSPGGVECEVVKAVPARWTTLLRYTCEDHGHGVTGISVYGLV